MGLDGLAVYTSVLDSREGDVNGATKRQSHGDGPADREPIAPPSLVPPQFDIAEQATGRLLITRQGLLGVCVERRPSRATQVPGCVHARVGPGTRARAVQTARRVFGIRAHPGLRQWALRGEPLYTRIGEERFHSLEGSDVPGWHNVYTQKAPPPPADFTVAESGGGLVLADRKGSTVYIYHCGDDGFDQQSCDHPRAPQVYRFAVCGGRRFSTLPRQVSLRTGNARCHQLEPAVERDGHRPAHRPTGCAGPGGCVACLGLSRAPRIYVRAR